MKKIDIWFFAILGMLLAGLVAEATFYPVNRGRIDTITRVTTSGATNELVATGNQVFIASGASSENFDLPNAQNLPNDWWYQFINNSSGTLTVRDYGNTNIFTVATGRPGYLFLRSNATQNGTWDYFVPASSGELANYYLQSQFISTSTGVADADKPVKTNGAGVIDSTLIPSVPATVAVSDTSSIDLTFSSSTLSADLRMSASAADAGNINATSSIEADGLQVQVPIADTNTTGVLTDTDWDTFNNKQAAGNYITALTGDVTASGPGSVAGTIANDAVTDAKLRESAAVSVIGRAANSTGNPADIAAGADYNILRRASSAVAFGSIDLSQSGAVGSSVLAVGNGGTGLSSGTSGGVPYFSASNTITSSGALTQYQVVLGGGAGAAPNVVSGTGTSGQVLTSNGAGANPTWQDAGGGGGAVFLGSLYRDGASSCSGTVSTQDTFVSYAADTDCPDYTATNSTYISAPATKVPGFVLEDAAIDTTKYYMIVVSGLFTLGGSGQCVYRMTDGTTNTLSANQNGASSGGPVTTGTWTVWYKPASTGDKTIQIQAAPEDAATQCILSGGSNTLKTLSFDVYRFDSI